MAAEPTVVHPHAARDGECGSDGYQAVFDAYARLSHDDRDVLSLRIVNDFSPEQAAVGLGVTRDAVEARLTSAMAHLRAITPDFDPVTLLVELRGLA